MGNLIWGRLSETSVGRRGAATIATLGGIALIPLYLFTISTPSMIIGALAMGVFGAGNFGVIPTYLNERFPTAVRAAGAGFACITFAGIVGKFIADNCRQPARPRRSPELGDGRLHRGQRNSGDRLAAARL